LAIRDLVALGDVNGDGVADLGVNGWARGSRGGLINRRATIFGGANITGQDLMIARDDWKSGVHEEAEQIAPDETVKPTTGYFIDDGTRREFVQSEAKAFAAGDLNTDGQGDFLVFDTTGRGSVYGIFGGDDFDEPIDLTTQPRVELPADSSVDGIAVVRSPLDQNGDQVHDAVFYVFSYGDSNGLFEILGNAELGSQSIVPTRMPSPLYDYDGFSDDSLATGDFNDDGQVDLVYVGWRGASVFLAGQDDLHLAQSAFSDVVDERPRAIRFDVNGDEVDDLLIGHPADGPRSEFGGAGTVTVLLGRPAVQLSGEGEFDQSFDIAPGTQMLLRVSGIVQEETLQSDLFFGLIADDQYEMNPLNNQWSSRPSDALFADISQNGAVDFADFLVVSSNFGIDEASLFDGDLNGDRRVDFADFLLLADAYPRA